LFRAAGSYPATTALRAPKFALACTAIVATIYQWWS